MPLNFNNIKTSNSMATPTPSSLLPENYNPQIASNLQSFEFDDVYSYGGAKEGFVSRYPTYLPNRDNEDYFGQQQGFWNKLRTSAQKFATLASNTYANHFAQYGRDFEALINWDRNEFFTGEGAERTAERIEFVNNKFPIYQTAKARERRERQKGLGGALKQYIPFTAGAGSAWAELGGQLGFTVGTIGAVITENVALALTTEGVGNVAKAPATARSVVKSFWHLAKAGKTFDTALDTSKLVVGAKGIGQTYRMFHASAGEATIEANLSALEYKRDQMEKYRELYGIEPDAQTIAQIEQDALKVGNVTFSWNIPVLMASNMVTIGSLFKAPSTITQGVYRGVGEGIIAQNGKFITAKEASKEALKGASLFNKGVFYGKQVLKKSPTVLGEGFEELAQGIGSASAQHLYGKYNSKYAEDTLGFMSILGKETAEALNSREGWDEFVAGALTGFGIGGFTSIYNRGDRIKMDEAREKAVKELNSVLTRLGTLSNVELTNAIKEALSPDKLENDNLITQAISAYGIQEASDRNDKKTALDIQAEALNKFFATMNKYDKLDEVLDMYGEAMNEMRDVNQGAFDEMMGGETVEQMKQRLKSKGKEWVKTFNNVDKTFRNQYDAKTERNKYVAYEKSKEILVGYHMLGRDAMERAQALATDLQTRGVNNEVINAISDPENLSQSIANIDSFIKIASENLTQAQTEGEKSALREDIDRQKKVLKILKEIEKTENGDPRDIASRIVGALDKISPDALPQELRQDIADLITLNDEGRLFTNMYNTLVDPEAFEKYFAGFWSVAKEQSPIKDQTAEEQLQEAQEEQDDILAETGTLNETEFNDELAEVEFDDVGVMQVADDALKLLEREDKKITEVDGKFQYDGQTYDTRDQAHNAILDKSQDKAKMGAKTASGSLRNTLKKRFNQTKQEAQPADPNETLREQPQPVEQPSLRSLNPPKTKESEQGKPPGIFSSFGGGLTLLHFFDKVVAMVWQKPHDLLGKLQQSKDPRHAEVAKNIEDAFKEFGNEAQLTMISLYSEGQIEKLNNDQIKVFSDGIRHYIVTKGNENVTKVIQEQLELHVEPTGGFSVVKAGNRDGADISSDFQMSSPKEESIEALHSLRPGEQLNVRVVDNEYNRNLKKNKPAGWKDHLIIEMYKVNPDGSEVAVGMLRATDFLFNSPAKSAEIGSFRDKVLSSPLGELVGTVPFVHFSSARNTNYKNGVMQFTNVGEYQLSMEEAGWDVEFYYARQPDQLIDKNGKPVDKSQLDRPSFRKGAIYMRVSKKGSNQEHTIQVFDDNKSNFSPNEFMDGSFKKRAQTNLKPRSNPLISKRIVADTSSIVPLSDTTITVPSGEKVYGESAKEPTRVDSFDNASNKKLWLINNGEVGQTYQMDDGSTVTVDRRNGQNEIIVIRRKGDFKTVEKYVFEEGKTKTENQVKGSISNTVYKRPNRSVYYDIYYKVMRGEPLSSREFNIAVRFPHKINEIRQAFDDFRKNINEDPIENMKRSLIFYGHDADTLFKGLLDAYIESVIARNPITEFEVLLEKAKLTEDQKAVMREVVDSISAPLVWAYLTQADAVYGFRRNEGFQNLLKDMQGEIRDLRDRVEGMNESKTPARKVSAVRDKVVETVREYMNVVGIDMINEKVMKYLPEPDFKRAVITILDTLAGVEEAVTTGIKNLQSKIADLGISLTLGQIMQVVKVDRQSKGRNPQYVSDYDNVITDIMMIEEGSSEDVVMVRNEADGLFVEVQNVNEEVTPEILTMKQKLLDLAGVEVSNKFLQAYKKINGDFSGLKRRLFKEEVRSGLEIPNSFGILQQEDPEAVKDRAMDRTDKLISVRGALRLVKSTDYYIKIDGTVFRNVLNVNEKQGVYVADTNLMSQNEIRDALLDAGVRPEKSKVLGSSIETNLGSQRKLDKLKDDLSCG